MIEDDGGERRDGDPRTYRRDPRSGLRRRPPGEELTPVPAEGTRTSGGGLRRAASEAGERLGMVVRRLALAGFVVYAIGFLIAGGIYQWQSTNRQGTGFVLTVPEGEITARALLWPLDVALWLVRQAPDAGRESPAGPARGEQ